MMAAQRLPLEFDGVVAGNPSWNLTRVVINQIYSLQTVTGIALRDAAGKPDLSRAITDVQLKAVSDAVLKKCDALDGLADGLINDFKACGFKPAELVCGNSGAPGKDQCLTAAQAGALIKSGSPLGGVVPRKMVLAGTSQTAGILINYLPGHVVYRTPKMERIYDGFMPTSNGSNITQEVDVPIIHVPTMHEVSGQTITWRQDSDEPGRQYRLYEFSGMAHVDTRDAARMIECVTQFEDGTLLSTQLDSVSPFQYGGAVQIERMPATSEAVEVYERHLARVEEHRVRHPQARALVAHDLEGMERRWSEGQRVKREYRRSVGYVTDAELRKLLGAQYERFAGKVRARIEAIAPDYA